MLELLAAEYDSGPRLRSFMPVRCVIALAAGLEAERAAAKVAPPGEHADERYEAAVVHVRVDGVLLARRLAVVADVLNLGVDLVTVAQRAPKHQFCPDHDPEESPVKLARPRAQLALEAVGDMVVHELCRPVSAPLRGGLPARGMHLGDLRMRQEARHYDVCELGGRSPAHAERVRGVQVAEMAVPPQPVGHPALSHAPDTLVTLPGPIEGVSLQRAGRGILRCLRPL
mmetsp:Transcript_96293/g.281276  ORF Transcript_96293/g.281276 Transcript_96293/m.281276 type:complete len:228 (-) Transcript_96293:547-1230(-)